MAYEQDRITGNAQDFRRPYEERTAGNGGVLAMVLLVVAVGAGAFIYASGEDAAVQEGAPAVTAPAATEPAATVPATDPAVAPDAVPLTPDAELAPPADGGAAAPEAADPAQPAAPAPAEPAPAN